MISSQRRRRRTGVALAVGGVVFVSVVAVAFGALPQQSGSVDLLTQANVAINGAAAGDNSGISVAGAGDVNGDGRADVIVGARFAGPSGLSAAGTSYVIYGSATPTTVDLSSLGAQGFAINGAAANDNSGDSVAGAGDVNGDGRADVIVGAYGADPSGRSAAGTSYVIYGFGIPSVSYAGGITATPGTAITPLTPTVSRTGTASFAVSPALPAGLFFDTTTGVMSGTPTEVSAAANYSVTMTDLSGQASTSVQISVPAPAAPAPAAVAPTPTTPVNTFTMKIRKTSGKSKSITTQLTLAGPGKVAQVGITRLSTPRRSSEMAKKKARTMTVCTARKTVAKAGKVTITCRLSAKARAARTKGSLKVRLVTIFTPTGGTAKSVSETLVLKTTR